MQKGFFVCILCSSLQMGDGGARVVGEMRVPEKKKGREKASFAFSSGAFCWGRRVPPFQKHHHRRRKKKRQQHRPRFRGNADQTKISTEAPKQPQSTKYMSFFIRKQEGNKKENEGEKALFLVFLPFLSLALAPSLAATSFLPTLSLSFPLSRSKLSLSLSPSLSLFLSPG